MKLIDNTKSVTIKIFSNKKEVNCGIHCIEVDKTVNRIASARVIVSDYELSEIDPFIPGVEIKIKVGYGIENEVIFEGVVVKFALKSLQRGTKSLVVDCRDPAYRMTLEPKNDIFHKATKEVISQLVQKHGLIPDLQNAKLENGEMKHVQYQVSDWEFVLTSAIGNGNYLCTNNGTLVMATPNVDAEEKLTVRSNDNIIEFEVELESRYQLPQSYGTFWDPSVQKLVDANGKAPKKQEQKSEGGNITSEDLAAIGKRNGPIMRLYGSDTKTELQAITAAQMLQSALSKIRGRIKCQGTYQVVPGDMIKLENLGERFDGKAFVSGVKHTINDRNWETDIQIGMSEDGISLPGQPNSSNRGNGLIPSIQGLHIGVVTKLSGDPLNQERIQVRVPIIHENNEGLWARLSTEYASENCGMVFRPEIEDEVVLGFLQDDSRQPIILGVLHSSKRATPLPASDEQNQQKGIITKGKMKILFDDQRESVNIESPGGKSIAINDKEGKVTIKDENSNQLIMSKEGIEINSAGILDINCMGKLSIKAPSVEIIGANFNCKAASIAMTGTGNMALTGGSVTIIPPPK